MKKRILAFMMQQPWYLEVPQQLWQPVKVRAVQQIR